MNQPIYQVFWWMTPEKNEKAEQLIEDYWNSHEAPFASRMFNQREIQLEEAIAVGKEYGFDLNQVMAFGDSKINLEMLAMASVCRSLWEMVVAV